MRSFVHRCSAVGLVLLLAAGAAVTPAGTAQAAKDKPPAPQYSKAFVAIAMDVEKAVKGEEWDNAIVALDKMLAMPAMSDDEKRYAYGQKIMVTQKKGDKPAFAATIEAYLGTGVVPADFVGPLNQQLAAYYSAQKDQPKAIHYFERYVEATPTAGTSEFETLGRLYLQQKDCANGLKWLGKAIDTAQAKGAPVQESWLQYRDRCYLDLGDKDGRLANIEELVRRYPKKDYYSRLVALYTQGAKEDRALHVAVFRLALRDTGLASVGEYLTAADTLLIAGSPGESLRALERGMKEGVVPSGGSNAQLLQDARDRMTEDRKALPNDEKTAAKNPKGELEVKLGLGYYSLGDWNKAIELVGRGLAKGGVKRVDDAQMLLGASLVELGRFADARAAFGRAAEAAGQGSYMSRLAVLWSAYVDRVAAVQAPAAAATPST
jgi:tetratricopeptide (TPR) repeat protein